MLCILGAHLSIHRPDIHTTELHSCLTIHRLSYRLYQKKCL